VFIQIDAALLTAALFLATTDRVPTFDVEAHCRDIAPRSAPIGYPEICMRKEWAARDRLVKQWTRFAAADKSHCVELTSMAEPTYTQLLTCLELATEVRNARERGRSTTGQGRR
jgi:hypothetical protein